MRIRHLDDDRPAGEGEILVRTDEASDEFIGGAPVPVDDEGWFATGDVGRLDDGILYITGRAQEKIIVGRLQRLPGRGRGRRPTLALVRDAVVVGLPDDRLGERPVAGHRLGRRARRAGARRRAAGRASPPTRCRVRCSRSTRCR